MLFVLDLLCFLIPHHVDELRLHELSVKVGDGILEGVLEALSALALVTSGLEATSEDGNALETNKEKRKD